MQNSMDPVRAFRYDERSITDKLQTMSSLLTSTTTRPILPLQTPLSLTTAVRHLSVISQVREFGMPGLWDERILTCSNSIPKSFHHAGWREWRSVQLLVCPMGPHPISGFLLTSQGTHSITVLLTSFPLIQRLISINLHRTHSSLI